MGPRKTQWDEDRCIDNNLLVRYIEKDTTPEETKRIREHLDECEICFRMVASMIRNEHNPITDAEKEEVRKLLKLTPDEQVEKILSYQTTIQKEQKTQPQNQFPDWLSKFLKPTPKYALAFASVILVLVISIIGYKTLFHTDFSSQYVFDKRVPYQYRSNALRSTGDISSKDVLLNKFISEFEIAMGAYAMRDYKSTIHNLEGLESTASELQARAGNQKYLAWIQDLNFYLGVSHLAIGRSTAKGLADKEKAQHLGKSIQYLLQAKSLARDRGFENYDRETYFLGLALGFSGKTGSAVKQLRQITPESDFYAESEKLIQEWAY